MNKYSKQLYNEYQKIHNKAVHMKLNIKMSPQKHHQLILRSKTSVNNNNIDGNVPLPAHIVSYSYDYLEENSDCDMPLDMSIKRMPTSPHPHSFHASQSDDDSELYKRHCAAAAAAAAEAASSLSSLSGHGRPTVITCVGAWNIESTLPPPPPYDLAASQARKNINSENFNDGNNHTKKSPIFLNGNSSSAARKIFQAGPVDPEIDEHFRRSLGMNYHELFVNEPSTYSRLESNDSVDDHFLKALGSTWTKLKDETKPQEIIIPVSETSAPPSDALHLSSRPLRDSPPVFMQTSNSHLSFRPFNSSAPVDSSRKTPCYKIQSEDSTIKCSLSHVSATTL